MSEPKQVIVMRKDLNMRKGKMVAQGSHASMKIFFDKAKQCRGIVTWLLEKLLGERLLLIPLNSLEHEWAVTGRFKKVCVSVDSEQELLSVYYNALDLGIPVALIVDSGLTEFNNVPTKTCIAVGPGDPASIDLVTGHLKLL